MFGWLRDNLLFGGKPRSGSWPRVRREHLKKEPACIACGRSRDVEVHHVVPFSEKPELELDPDNLVTLDTPCHFVFGHLLNWSSSNPHVRDDATAYRRRITQERN